MFYVVLKHASHGLILGSKVNKRGVIYLFPPVVSTFFRLQVLQNEVQLRLLHRRTVGLRRHLPRDQSLFSCSGKKGTLLLRHTCRGNARVKRKAYDCLTDEGYSHLSVNHSLNFVDPDTGAHTQRL